MHVRLGCHGSVLPFGLFSHTQRIHQNMEPLNLRIAIVGGGPGGLGTAIALRRAGFKNITVYERDQDADARKQGYSFTLRAPEGGLGYINKYGLYADVEPHGFDVKMMVVDGPSGSRLLQFSPESTFNEEGEGARRIMRGGMRNILVTVCQREGIKIVWNWKYLSYEEKEESVLLNFEGKPQVEADIVIAADGLNSKIRDQLTGDPVRYTGYTAVYSKLFPKDAPELFEHPQIKESGALFAGPNCSFFFFHLKTQHSNELHWVASYSMPEGELKRICGDSNEALLKYVLDTFKDWPGIPRKIIESTLPSGVDASWEYRDRVPLKVNTKTGRVCNSKSGRITILGDAAHPMLPFRGAGGNNALMDAWKLSDTLATLIPLKQVTGKDIQKVLSAYEKEMTARGGNAMEGSRQAANYFHTASAVTRTIRNVMYRALDWRLNTYGPNKWLRWTIKTTVAGVLIGGISLALAHFKLIQNEHINLLKKALRIH